MSAAAPVILILDDEEMVRENIQVFFEDEGYATLTASSGEEALKLLESNKVDVCIVDMRLPGMSGNDFILKANAAYPGTRCLIHTGSTNYKLPSALIDLGVTRDMVFIKPLRDLYILANAVNDLLAAERGQ